MFRQRQRGFLILAVTVAIVSVTTLGWRMLRRVPDPATSSTQEMLRWLAWNDIATHAPAFQLQWVDRFSAELQDGLASRADSLDWSDPQFSRLAANILHLQSVWFYDRTARYADVAPADRWDFLSTEIDTVMHWSALDLPRGNPNQDSVEFMDQISAWMDAAPPESQVQVRQAVEDATLCWLATSDLADASEETRSALALRLARRLDAGYSATDMRLALRPHHQERLVQNSRLLAEAWLQEQAAKYATLAADQRLAFLDQQIERLTNWRLGELLAPQNDSSGSGQMLKLLPLINDWVARADEPDKERLTKLIADVQARWFVRRFQAFLPTTAGSE